MAFLMERLIRPFSSMPMTLALTLLSHAEMLRDVIHIGIGDLGNVQGRTCSPAAGRTRRTL